VRSVASLAAEEKKKGENTASVKEEKNGQGGKLSHTDKTKNANTHHHPIAWPKVNPSKTTHMIIASRRQKTRSP